MRQEYIITQYSRFYRLNGGYGAPDRPGDLDVLNPVGVSALSSTQSECPHLPHLYFDRPTLAVTEGPHTRSQAGSSTSVLYLGRSVLRAPPLWLNLFLTAMGCTYVAVICLVQTLLLKVVAVSTVACHLPTHPPLALSRVGHAAADDSSRC